MGERGPTSGHGPFEGPPRDTEERIMRATFEALRRYGYAGLSIGRIAEESELSKSSVYHFYDDKEDLLVAFLEFVIDRWGEEFPFQGGDPVATLRAYLTFAVTGRMPAPWGDDADTPEDAFFGPYVELRSQAVTNDAYRERFTRFESVFLDEVATVVEAGIERGAFREVDPDGAAEVVLTLVMGAIFRRETVTEFDAEAVDEEVERVLDDYLLVEDR